MRPCHITLKYKKKTLFKKFKFKNKKYFMLAKIFDT